MYILVVPRQGWGGRGRGLPGVGGSSLISAQYSTTTSYLALATTIFCGDWWGSTTLTRSPVLIMWTLEDLLMIFKGWSPILPAQSPSECPWSNHFWFVLCRKKQTIMLKIIKSWPKQTCWFRNFPPLELLGRSALRYERWSWYRRTQNTFLFLFRCVSMT